MDAPSYVALSRQLGLERQLAVIANNIANANTTGYLADDMSFEAVRQRASRRVEVAYVQDLTVRPDLTEGELVGTGGIFDFGIAGDGFFAVETPGGTRYTRAGHFRLDEDNQLVTWDGHPVLDTGDAPIVLPADNSRLQVAGDGTLSIDDEVVGQMQRARFADPGLLEREGAMLFRSDERPTAATDAQVSQGMLEASNVEPVLAMTAMLETTRAFEATQKLIEAQHDLTRQAVERLLDTKS
ncbi:MAG: flagellar basal-body rod protein FlgF [Pseudomonadota bacterium]